MHDFKYRSLITGEAQWTPQMGAVRSECLRPLCDAFTTNLMRAMTFAFTPTEISFRVKLRQVWLDYATLKITGKLEPDLPQSVKSQAIADEINREMTRLHTDFYCRPPREIQKLKDELGVSFVEDLLKTSEGMQMAVEALFSAIILESWTAFECLASDLWVEGVDNGPGDIVAQLTIASPKAFKKQEDNIRPETVRELGINAKTHYGSFLREIGAVTFQNLRDIQRYYEIAFGKEASSLFDETSGGYIFALAAFRNALIHNAGKADKVFVRQVQRFPEFSKIMPKQKPLLDGELVRKLRNSAILLASHLIQLVDKILTAS